jgi:hypothetical protein
MQIGSSMPFVSRMVFKNVWPSSKACNSIQDFNSGLKNTMEKEK